MGGHWRPTPRDFQALSFRLVVRITAEHRRSLPGLAGEGDLAGSSPTPHLAFEPPLEVEDSAFLPRGLQSPSMHVITSSFWEVSPGPGPTGSPRAAHAQQPGPAGRPCARPEVTEGHQFSAQAWWLRPPGQCT